ncbi:hypothetical protein M569_05358 [Genlisea aurea]|uniref:Uncharacterized protein n=1 Tax=Genlisea aurea TaxID=192259 RepID=S8CQI3_9LAMI|nr:hypothetical protein M569_05358 [Genlisea aurea]
MSDLKFCSLNSLMTKEVNIRVVRCPKCRVLLPELPEHPLYRCGNCETVIQAKNQRISNVKLESNETVSPDISEENSGVSHGVELHGVISLSEGPSTSPEIVCPENEHKCCSNIAEDDESVKRRGKKKLFSENTEEEEEEEECDEKSKNSLSMSESHVSLYITSPDQDQANLHPSRLNGPDFGRNGSLDTSESSPTSEHDLKPHAISKYPGTTSSYYAHDCSESDETKNRDFQRNKGGVVRKDAHKPVSHRTLRNNRFSGPSEGSLSSNVNLRKSETENLDLLRTVWELKDQLDRMHLSEIPPNGRFTNHPEAHPEDHLFSRHAFLGKSLRHGAPVSCHCLHCYPQDLHRSAHLACHCNYSCTQYCCDTSTSMSPQHNHPRRIMSLRGIEVNPKKTRVQAVAVSRLLPVSGGAPFVGCYNCWEVLQIPAEFIIIKKRYHKLMCGSCKKVLRFTLSKDAQLAPWPAKDSVPPLMAAVSSSQRGNMRKGKEEAVQESSTSPLHHLMGYASPSQVMDN